eukprot:PLAT13692.1.p1 GENE.PLAT13692.1~~PLAT13692.1.p1  ORF type:complete len:740 (+),score=386.09 PLAT13692.1:52-2271(+)
MFKRKPGKKKLVIRPFRARATIDSSSSDSIWELLKSAIREIYAHNASNLSFEELYRNAYNLVLHKHGEKLYNGVVGEVRAHLRAVASELTGTTAADELASLAAAWNDHKVTMTMIRDILMYMDRVYVVQHNRTIIYDRGLELFREIVVGNDHIRSRTLALLLASVQRERSGELVDRLLMKQTLSMLVDLGLKTKSVYVDLFERPFLQTTAEFYRRESQLFLDSNACPDYLLKAEARIDEEAQRVRHYLDDSTESKLREIVDNELVRVHAKTLVEMESGLVAMIETDKIDDLRRMYTLLSRVPMTLGDVQRVLDAHVRETGKALVTDQETAKDPVAFVQALLEMRDKYERILADAWAGDKEMARTLKEAFEQFVNLDSRVAQFLSLYVDELLRHSVRGLTEDAIEERLEKVIILFRYLRDKDVFESFYKSHLAKRLLSGRSVSDDAERLMIAKLKTECGYQFTAKLEGMFQDMRLSRETMEHYGRVVAGRHSIELSVSILTAGFWPTASVPACTLPDELKAVTTAFREFYLGIHTGRRLSWQCNLGNADVKMLGGKERHELNVTTYQMVILLLFNLLGKEVSFSDIKERTGIPEPDLSRHLVSLCTPKARILRKSAKGMSFKPEDTFKINSAFHSRLYRVKVPLVSARKKKRGEGGSGGGSAIPAAVEEGRRHQIEAALVRIMKARRQLEHSLLVAEATKQLSSRFVPSPSSIKKRIESLIEREYLERTEEDRRTYRYLA